MSLQLDHIVLLVDDLHKAKQDFGSLGFKVSEGGIHSGGITQNALIHFRNGTFLELLALRKNLKTFTFRFLAKYGLHSLWLRSKKSGFLARFIGRALACPEGITDFCLQATGGLQDYEALRSRGLQCTLPRTMQRQRPDGIVLQWQIFTSFDKELPFVMTPYQPRIPLSTAMFSHPNRIDGIAGIQVNVARLEDATQKYSQLLGFSPQVKNQDSCRFDTPTGFIELRQQKRPPTSSGLGIFSIHFLTEGSFVLDPGKLHGLEINS